MVRATAGAELVAPASVPWEIGNAFSAMLKRGRITTDGAASALALYATIPVRFVEVDLAAAVQLAGRLGIYAYDAYLIATALGRGCPLLTLDRGLIHAARQAGATIVEVSV